MIAASRVMLHSERALFASDLHLDGSARREVGLRRILELAERRDADLYLLGDVFHYWFGPKHLGIPMYQRELALFERATSRGRRIHIVPGNRDFLLDQTFCRETGVEVAGDRLDVEVCGERIHLSHGDLFSTYDIRYQRMRRVLRHPMVSFLAHQLPTSWVHSMASGLRRHSERVVKQKPAEVLQPDRDAVRSILESGFDTVICGHFHASIRERLDVSGGEGASREGTLIILEPYEEHGYVLERSLKGWEELRIEGQESHENRS